MLVPWIRLPPALLFAAICSAGFASLSACGPTGAVILPPNDVDPDADSPLTPSGRLAVFTQSDSGSARLFANLMYGHSFALYDFTTPAKWALTSSTKANVATYGV